MNFKGGTESVYICTVLCEYTSEVYTHNTVQILHEVLVICSIVCFKLKLLTTFSHAGLCLYI